MPSDRDARKDTRLYPGTGIDVRIPLIHITDLYHPPQDPDDHFDLATVASLPEFDLQGVILDVTTKFLEGAPRGFDIPRDPGFVPVVQLGYLLGRAIPVAAGPTEPLRYPGDAARDRHITQQAGIELLLHIVRSSSQPVTISVVSSARVLAAAFNRDPELMLNKTRAVLLNAGTSAGTHDEWNVGLDRFAFIDLWKSGLPIHWYPCANENGAHDERHQHGSHWQATHEELLRGTSQRLQGWFCHALAGNPRGDIIRALHEEGRGAVWEHILSAQRHLWSTASLVMAADRILARTSEGWRFIPAEKPSAVESWPMSLEPIVAAVRDDGIVDWQPVAEPAAHRIFRRQEGHGYGTAMTDALNALLCSLPC